MKSFSKGVHEQLGYYVYRLIDPRDGQTFYVGRGQGDRLFDHANGELALQEVEELKNAKLEIVREIRRAGLEVIHVVHRHYMSKESAEEVEAALIDVTPGLMNVAPGKGSRIRGPANAEQLDRRYSKRALIENPDHKLMYIKIKEGTLHDKGLYQAVRRSWPVNRDIANQADYVLAVIDQVVRGVFKDCKWGPSQEQISSAKNKSEFVGDEVIGEAADGYLGLLIPEKYREKGMQSPWFYSWT